MYVGLKALLRPGARVAMSPYTLYDVVNMVLAAGCEPYFVDVDPQTGNLDPDALEQVLDDGIDAVMATHLHGIAADIHGLADLCASRDIPLLEDACQAFGARVNGRCLGTFGRIGFFSTGRAKNLNSFLGGFAATDDDALAEAMRSTFAAWPPERQQRLWKRIGHCFAGDVATTRPVFTILTYWIFRHGVLNDVESVTRQFNTEVNPVRRDMLPSAYQVRSTALQARVLERQINRAGELSRRRIALARLYYEGLHDLRHVTLPPFHEDGSDIYLAYPVQVPDRIGLLKYLAKHKRDLAVQHIGNAADLPCFSDYSRDCPTARSVANSVLLLPTYPLYSKKEAERNIVLIRQYFEHPPR
jgi:dTDP-4-amino-4,6-dideoxygalactose transaminase